MRIRPRPCSPQAAASKRPSGPPAGLPDAGACECRSGGAHPRTVTPDTILALLVAPFVGSFLGVVVERLPTGRPIALARSACDHCGETLAARDLVLDLSAFDVWAERWLAVGSDP